MKRIIFFFSVIFSMLFTLSLSGKAYHMPIDIEVNGQKIITDSAPFIEDGTVYVPIRAISESLNLSCYWDTEERCAYIDGKNTSLEFLPDNSICYVNGKRKKVQSFIKEGRIMVPVRFVSENYNSLVTWDSKFYRVLINKDDVSVPGDYKDYTYTQDEVYWLSRIIHAEASGESKKGLIAVGNVVLNRVKSVLFPNTIYGVIFDRKGGAQFEPILNGSIYCNPSYDSIDAAKRALSGENTAGASLYFLNPKIAQSSWIVKNRKYLKTIGNHDFYM